GVPLLYYLIELPSYPTIRATCDPADCAVNPAFILGTIRPDNCPIPGFATREEAEMAVQQQLPFPPAPWFIVQAADPAHAFATVIVEVSNPPGAVPASLIAAAEDYVAAAFNEVCSPGSS